MESGSPMIALIWSTVKLGMSLECLKKKLNISNKVIQRVLFNFLSANQKPAFFLIPATLK